MGLGLGAQPTHLEAVGLRPGLLEREASIEDGLHLQLGREDVRESVACQHDARAHLGREQRHERVRSPAARLRERLLPRLAHFGACRQETQGGWPAASSRRLRSRQSIPRAARTFDQPQPVRHLGHINTAFDTVWRQGGGCCSLAARVPPARPRRQLPPSCQRAVDHAANARRIARCLAATNVLELLDRSRLPLTSSPSRA